MEGDAREQVKAERPDSKWIVWKEANIAFYVNHTVDHPIGEAIDLPAYLKNNNKPHQQPHNGQFDKDNLCFFQSACSSKRIQSEKFEDKSHSLFQESNS